MAQAWLAQQRRGAAIRGRARPGIAAGRGLRGGGRRAHADRAGDARLLPERSQDGHRGLTTLCHDRGALRVPRRLPAHGLGPDRRPRARRRFHGDRLPEVSAGRRRASAFLYVRRDLIERLEPTITGWFGRVNPFAFRIERSTGRRLPAGSRAARRRCRTPTRRSARWSCSTALATRRSASRSSGWWSGTGPRPATRASWSGRRPTPERRGPLVVVQSLDAPALVVTAGRARHRRVVPRQRTPRVVSRLQQRGGRGCRDGGARRECRPARAPSHGLAARHGSM